VIKPVPKRDFQAGALRQVSSCQSQHTYNQVDLSTQYICLERVSPRCHCSTAWIQCLKQFTLLRRSLFMCAESALCMERGHHAIVCKCFDELLHTHKYQSCMPADMCKFIHKTHSTRSRNQTWETVRQCMSSTERERLLSRMCHAQSILTSKMHACKRGSCIFTPYM
jgi:hypothetical protein